MESQTILRIFISQLRAPFQYVQAVLASWTRTSGVPPQLEDITWEDTQ